MRGERPAAALRAPAAFLSFPSLPSPPLPPPPAACLPFSPLQPPAERVLSRGFLDFARGKLRTGPGRVSVGAEGLSVFAAARNGVGYTFS